jgi:hypothetical protein
LFLHLGIVFALSLIVLGNGGDGYKGIQLLGVDDGELAEKELTRFEIQSDRLESTPSEIPGEPEANATSESNLSDLFASSSAASPSALTSSLLTESQLAVLSQGGSGLGDGGGEPSRKGSAQGSGATFFGARAEGYRFVFVIDSSTSMLGPRWEALQIELKRAIQSLSPDQEFFVLSFDSGAHPMFGKLPPQGEFLPPTKENVDRLSRWVGSIQHQGFTLPASAIGIALRMKPDAIFLLSDGEIRDTTVFDLRRFNREPDEDGETRVMVPIHTVLLHSDVGYLPLRTIAEENDGVFTPVFLGREQ